MEMLQFFFFFGGNFKFTVIQYKVSPIKAAKGLTHGDRVMVLAIRMTGECADHHRIHKKNLPTSRGFFF